MMVEAITLGVKQWLNLFVLEPTGIVDYILLLSANDAFVALEVVPADCVNALQGLSVDIALVAHDILTIEERLRGLIVLDPVILVFDYVFRLLVVVWLNRLQYIFAYLRGIWNDFVLEMISCILVVAVIGNHKLRLSVSRQH